MSYKKFLAVAGILVLPAAAAFASTIPLPSLLPVAGGTPVAGQSNITSFTNPGDTVNIDWIVVRGDYVSGVTNIPMAFGTDATDFVYLYQIENDTSTPVGTNPLTGLPIFTGVDQLTLSNWDTDLNNDTVGDNPSAAQYVTGLPFGLDLDVASVFNPAHDVANFANLAGESEPPGFPPPSLSVLGTVDPTGVSWGFSTTPILKDFESHGIFFFVVKIPPTYGNAVLQDTVMPSPWASTAPGGQQVPIPAPEPGTIFLLGLGVLGLYATRRRG